jgi:hypothetical protein
MFNINTLVAERLDVCFWSVDYFQILRIFSCILNTSSNTYWHRTTPLCYVTKKTYITSQQTSFAKSKRFGDLMKRVQDTFIERVPSNWDLNTNIFAWRTCKMHQMCIIFTTQAIWRAHRKCILDWIANSDTCHPKGNRTHGPRGLAWSGDGMSLFQTCFYSEALQQLGGEYLCSENATIAFWSTANSDDRPQFFGKIARFIW